MFWVLLLVFFASFASALDIDLSEVTDSKQALENVRTHFLRANPIQLRLIRLGGKDKCATFLRDIANLAIRLEPRGRIEVEVEDKSIFNEFNSLFQNIVGVKRVHVALVPGFRESFLAIVENDF